MNDPVKAFDDFLIVLNEAVTLDRNAVDMLCEHRVECNDALADHPTIQVAGLPGQIAHVGMIGIINGICERITGRRVAADYDTDGNLLKFVPYEEE